MKGIFLAIFAGIFVPVILLSSCGSPLRSVNKCTVAGEVPIIDTNVPSRVETATFAMG